MARVGQIYSKDDAPKRERIEELAEETERVADRSIGAMREATARSLEAGERSVRKAGDLGSAYGEFLSEQTQHALRTAMAVGGATDWQEIIRAQREFLDGTLERTRKFAEHYVAAVRTTMNAVSGVARP